MSKIAAFTTILHSSVGSSGETLACHITILDRHVLLHAIIVVVQDGSCCLTFGQSAQCVVYLIVCEV